MFTGGDAARCDGRALYVGRGPSLALSKLGKLCSMVARSKLEPTVLLLLPRLVAANRRSSLASRSLAIAFWRMMRGSLNRSMEGYRAWPNHSSVRLRRDSRERLLRTSAKGRRRSPTRQKSGSRRDKPSALPCAEAVTYGVFGRWERDRDHVPLLTEVETLLALGRHLFLLDVDDRTRSARLRWDRDTRQSSCVL